MTQKQNDEFYQVVWLVRRLFRALALKANENLHGYEYELSVADRAVMEFLYPDKQLSVPGIASLYKVSRQHVQVTINSLLEAGLIESKPNPRHKRSSLMQLSDTGVELFARILDKDNIVVNKLFEKVPAKDRVITRRTLEIMLEKLSAEE